MRRGSGRALCALAVALVGWTASPVVAGAETAPATIVHDHPDRACAGDAATLVWSPPEGVADLTGYQITRSLTTPGTPQFWSTTVGPEQTSLDFTVPYGLSIFSIRAITSEGVASTPFTSAVIMGNRAPMAMTWTPEGASVGDQAATVPFRWHGPLNWTPAGGLLPATVTVTASPGGDSIESPASLSAPAVAPTFTGLTNGLPYTFTAVTSNACGSSGPETSPTYVPGVPPAWTQADPPLTVAKNKTYSYQFAASGTPSPTYLLLSAPDWLAIGPDGSVSGDPPKGTTSFSYSVLARGAGVEPWFGPVFAGPFTVEVTRGRSTTHKPFKP